MDSVPAPDPMTEMALRTLHDIAMPQPVSWMPQTWGWALLATVVLLALLATAIRAIRRFRRNAYRREALRLLADLEEGMGETGDRAHAFRQLAELLKRTALAAWPRSQVAALAGTEWVEFIDQSADSGPELARLLDDLEYRENVALSTLSHSQATDAVRSANRWIEQHHVRV
jgi:hypothetical protein